MCECGCVSNDDKFSFPAPGKSLYILTLSGACKNCDAPAGVCIEMIAPDNVLYKEYKRGDFLNGPLEFEQWPDSKGIAVITGMRTHEFVEAMRNHLVGIDSRKLGDDSGRIDTAGADVIAEEMYDDSQAMPQLSKPVLVARGE